MLGRAIIFLDVSAEQQSNKEQTMTIVHGYFFSRFRYTTRSHISVVSLSQMDYHWLAHSSLLCHGCMCAHTRVHANMSTAQIFMHLCAYLGTWCACLGTSDISWYLIASQHAGGCAYLGTSDILWYLQVSAWFKHEYKHLRCTLVRGCTYQTRWADNNHELKWT